jgi:rhodanese-related sulfurtransferase
MAGQTPVWTGRQIVRGSAVVSGHRTTINVLLAAARKRLARLEPTQAVAAVRDGAVIVDIRSEDDRERDGVIPGAVFVPRNVLEWRLDPASGHSNPELGNGLHRHIILVCNEGYQSSLAAATLQDLGFARATDLAGGFQAWRAAGLPVDGAPPSAALAHAGHDSISKMPQDHGS